MLGDQRGLRVRQIANLKMGREIENERQRERETKERENEKMNMKKSVRKK